MAFRRKSSEVITAAQKRAANLTAISAALDLGGGLTLPEFNTQIAAAQAALNAYNSLLAQADAAANTFKEAERTLRGLSARMLAGVGARYGKDSSEYEMAGGTRASEINYHPNLPPGEPAAGSAGGRERQAARQQRDLTGRPGRAASP